MHIPDDDNREWPSILHKHNLGWKLDNRERPSVLHKKTKPLMVWILDHAINGA